MFYQRSSESSGMYCCVLYWMSTDVSEVRTASIIIALMMEAARTSETSVNIVKNTSLHPRRFWASYSPPWELEISHSIKDYTEVFYMIYKEDILPVQYTRIMSFERSTSTREIVLLNLKFIIFNVPALTLLLHRSEVALQFSENVTFLDVCTIKHVISKEVYIDTRGSRDISLLTVAYRLGNVSQPFPFNVSDTEDPLQKLSNALFYSI
jgi:hypothetical protein